jgi:DNA-binding SARP family transcriptional activator
MFRLTVFGGFELGDGAGRSLKPAARKDAALLAYLALRRRPTHRGILADLLWPDRSEEQARKSLRQSLVALRRLLKCGVEAIPADRGSAVAIRPGLVTVDVLEFEAHATSGALDAALSLHQGTILEGFDGLSEPFSDWLETERIRMDDLAAQLLAKRCRSGLETGNWAASVNDARRLVEIEPFREEGHRLLMRALDGAGRRAEALQQFHRFSGLLRKELDVGPDPETAALYHAIRKYPTGPAASGCGATCNTGSSAARTRRPGLVVLPFSTVGEGASDDTLPNGLVEELVTTLAQYRWFYVVSHLQASLYRRTVVAPPQLRAELGVHYILSGKLERKGRRVGLTRELLSAESSEHLWSGKLEAHVDEAVAAQDEIARTIAAQIEPELVHAEVDIVLRTPERAFDVWSLLMRARQQADTCRPDAIRQALDLTEDALRMAPESALGQATRAYVCWLDVILAEGNESRVDEGIDAAQRAIAIDPRFYLGHSALGSLLFNQRRYETSTASLRRAIDSNPSFPVAYNQLASCLSLGGRPGEALEWVERLQEISPSDPLRGFYGCVRAIAHYLLGDDVAAIENAELSVAEHPGWLTSELILAAACYRAGRCVEARSVAGRIAARYPSLTRDTVDNVFRPKRETDLCLIVDPLVALGVVA